MHGQEDKKIQYITCLRRIIPDNSIGGIYHGRISTDSGDIVWQIIPFQ